MEKKHQALAFLLALILAPVLVSAASDITINVDTSQVLRDFPVNYKSVAQGDILPMRTEEMARRGRDIGVQYVRIDHLLEHVVTSESGGTMTYDWTRIDADIEQIISMGAEPIMCLSYMPGPLQKTGDNGLIRAPKSWALWEELIYQVAKRYNVDRGYNIKYWEVWNEPNSGGFWADGLNNYLTLYDYTQQGLHRADPTAKIGGPAIAGGPLSTSWYGDHNGDDYVYGLMQHCAQNSKPLDFISWHEYAWPTEQYRREVQIIKDWLTNDFPQLGDPELFITEFNFSWGFTDGNDTRVGATWACNTLFRGMLPAGVDIPCFFLYQDHNSAEQFRGYWGMLTDDGTPKAQYNLYKMINMLGDFIVDDDVDEDDDFYYDIGVLPTTFDHPKDVAVLCWYNWVGGEDRQFTVRWQGDLYCPEAGTYNFRVEMDDGFYFKIDSSVLHSELRQGWYPKTFSKYLSQGTHSFLLEYHEVLGNGKAKLWWTKPSGAEAYLNQEYVSHGGQSGFQADYYSGPNFDQLEFSRTDNEINFDWGWGKAPFDGPLSEEVPYNITLNLTNAPFERATMERYEISLSYANAKEIDLDHAELEIVETIEGVTPEQPVTFSIENHNVMLVRFLDEISRATPTPVTEVSEKTWKLYE